MTLLPDDVGSERLWNVELRIHIDAASRPRRFAKIQKTIIGNFIATNGVFICYAIIYMLNETYT